VFADSRVHVASNGVLSCVEPVVPSPTTGATR
jgi:hypothetical protein